MEKFNYKEFMKVQKELNAPKNQYNSFGKYKYRSCEDIIEAAKPLCISNGFILTISDCIELIGDRYYVKATASVIDVDGNTFSASAYAREELDKKGMDAAQLTGATSSYARKYALNGLLAIDDSKDADTDEHKQEVIGKQQKSTSKPKLITTDQALALVTLTAEVGSDLSKVLAHYNVTNLEQMTVDVYERATKALEAKRA